MTFFSDETGAESSSPREGIEIRHGLVVHRIATGSRDETINSNVFKAAPGERGDVQIRPATQDVDFAFTLPTSHAFSQRYLGAISPPRTPIVTVWRKQAGGEVQRQFQGVVLRAVATGHLVEFSCASPTSRYLQRRLPMFARSKFCPYTLYDSNCKVPRTTPFRQVTTVASHDGRTVVVASMGGHPDHYAQHGELLHVPSGERMTISDQVGTTITMQLPIHELRDGDQVHVFAGCNHDIATCRDTFANVINYGGDPHMPTGNVFLWGTTFGTYQSE